jgi:hypothetical protein
MPTGLIPLTASFAPQEGGVGSLQLLGPELSLVWNGRMDSGQVVDSGVYSVVVQVRDPFGLVTSWSQSLTVLRSDSQTTVEIYNSAGELVWRRQAVPESPGLVLLSGRELAPGPGEAGLKISYGSGSADFQVWNGTGSDGQALNSGNYLVKVTQAGGSTYSYTVTLLQASTQVFEGLIAAPNPIPSGSALLTIRLQGAAPGIRSWGEAYNLAGEHVASLGSSTGACLRWDIPAGLAPGVYWLQVSARDSQGRIKTAALKLFLLR